MTLKQAAAIQCFVSLLRRAGSSADRASLASQAWEDASALAAAEPTEAADAIVETNSPPAKARRTAKPKDNAKKG